MASTDQLPAATRHEGPPTQNGQLEQGSGEKRNAPTYTVPPKRLGIVEHPMLIKDIDKGLQTFGRGPSFVSILDSSSPQLSIPLYFRPDNPTVRPLTSHNAATHNIILKITLPARTGRKRKRGTDDPFEGPTLPTPPETAPPKSDPPSLLRRKLRDTAGHYALTPVGTAHNTHRYRGLSDFQYSMGRSPFMNRFVAQVVAPGSIAGIRRFGIEVGTAQPPCVDLVPPPGFAPAGMPNAYGYAQNPFVRGYGGDGGEEAAAVAKRRREGESESEEGEEGDGDEVDVEAEFDRVVNTSMRGPAPGYFIRYNEFPSPARPRVPPDLSDPHVRAVMEELHRAFAERPVWTRRSMFNRLSAAVASLPKSGNIIKHCIQYAGYQFRGGPWRDSLVRYGVDPRADPKYRVYQTLIFKLHKRRVGNVGGSWQSVRRKEVSTLSGSFGRYWSGLEGRGEEGGEARGGGGYSRGHEFDGTSFTTDGKVWQVCDITDPLLRRLFEEAKPLGECDFEKSGWYTPVLWFVAKAIMKRKMLAIRFKRDLPDEAFEPALQIVREAAEAEMGGGLQVDNINVPLPDLGLTTEEREQIRGRKVKSGRKGQERKEKNKNAPLRIRQKRKDEPREVRIVEYPADGRLQIVERISQTPSRAHSSQPVEEAGEPVRADSQGDIVGEVVETEETLRDLIESDEEDQDDEDDEEESDSESEVDDESLEDEEQDLEEDIEDFGEDYDSGDDEDDGLDDTGAVEY